MRARMPVLLATLWMAPGISAAATIDVPADQPTIQAAIDVAADGDVIRVAAGTYVENLNFAGKDIVVESADGAATTVIDGGGAESVVTFAQSEPRSTVLRGFTITNGLASEGGGIVVLGASPTIEENIVTGNVACAGAGIGLGGAAALVRNNEIVSNQKGGCGGGIGGGGISVRGAAQPEFYDNVIATNTSTDGAGISLFASGSPIIARNEIRGNNASALGGAIKMVNSSDVLIVNNTIYDNTAREGSAFYWLIPASTPVIRFNTMYNNSVQSASSATMHTDGFDGMGIVSSNIIIAPAGETAFYCGDFNDPEFPLIEANNVVAPGGTLYSGICTDQTGINGNVSTAPQFADEANRDFRLVAGSPMVDVGVDNVDVTDDFLGNARPVDGDGDMADISDIGAFEATPPVADAGAAATVNAGANVGLDGSGSSDADGTIASYQWRQTSGTNVTLTNGNTATPSFAAPGTAATLVFELTATDDTGFQATDDVTVTVNAPAPPPQSSGGGGALDWLTLMMLLGVFGAYYLPIATSVRTAC